MTLLEAYNIILAANGDAPISAIAGNEWIVGLISPFLEKNRRMVLSMGLGSNVDTQALAVNEDDTIVVPTSVLKLRFPQGFDYLTIRNGLVYNRNTQTNHAEAITVLATFDFPFDQLDDMTQDWIVNLTARDFRLRQSGEYDSKCAFYDEQAKSCKMRSLNSNPQNSINLSGWGSTVNAYASGGQ